MHDVDDEKPNFLFLIHHSAHVERLLLREANADAGLPRVFDADDHLLDQAKAPGVIGVIENATLATKRVTRLMTFRVVRTTLGVGFKHHTQDVITLDLNGIAIAIHKGVRPQVTYLVPNFVLVVEAEHQPIIALGVIMTAGAKRKQHARHFFGRVTLLGVAVPLLGLLARGGGVFQLIRFFLDLVRCLDSG